MICDNVEGVTVGLGKEPNRNCRYSVPLRYTLQSTANIFETVRVKFYQNQPSFVEGIITFAYFLAPQPKQVVRGLCFRVVRALSVRPLGLTPTPRDTISFH